MVTFKQIAVIVLVLLVAALAAIYYYSSTPQVASSQDVQKYVLDDLQSDPTFIGQDALFSVYSVTYDNATGQWDATAKITLNPHGSCPTVYLRDYNLLPIRHDTDKLVTSDCQTTDVIAFPEEAIADSRSVPQVAAMLNSNPYACGFELPLEDPATLESYCPEVSYSSLQGFANSAPAGAKWITSWTTGNSTLLVALDQSGNELTSGPG